MLIQYRQGYMRGCAGGWEGCFLWGLTPFMLFREITFQKCHRHGIIKHTHTHTHTRVVCWLCQSAGVINQRCVVRGSNMSRAEKSSSGTVHEVCCSTALLLGCSAARSLWLCTLARPSDRGQITRGDLLRVCPCSWPQWQTATSLMEYSGAGS